MAIITSVVIENALYENQYVRVENVQLSKNDMMIDIGVYFSQEWATENPPHTIETLNWTFDLYSNLNVWEQAYERLKQRWPASIDC